MMLSARKPGCQKTLCLWHKRPEAARAAGEAGHSGGSLLQHGSGRAACHVQRSQRCQFQIASPVPQQSAFLIKPQLRGWRNRESPSPSSQAGLLPRPHRTALAARRCGEIKSHHRLSCLKLLGPAPVLGCLPGFAHQSWQGAGTHTALATRGGSIWKQLSHCSRICHPLSILV